MLNRQLLVLCAWLMFWFVICYRYKECVVLYTGQITSYLDDEHEENQLLYPVDSPTYAHYLVDSEDGIYSDCKIISN